MGASTRGSPAPTQKPGAKESGARVVVVDDDVVYREELVELLTGLGYRARGAPNGRLGFVEIETFRADIAILDINMPGWDGLQTSEALARFNHRIKVIFVSGDDLALDRARRMTGLSVYGLAKPIDVPALRAILDGLVPSPA